MTATNTSNPWAPVELAKAKPQSLDTPVTVSTQDATATPATSAPATNTATTMSVAEDQLVSGRLNKLLASGSPVFDRAQARAAQAANARGLINSSMANQAGAAALYDVAVPMATNEAQAFQQAAVQNQNATNTANLQTQQLGTQVALTNAAAKNQVSMFNSEQYLKAKTVEADSYLKTILATADNNLKAYMAELESNYKTLMQTDASTASVLTQYLKAMAEVQSSANLDATGKQTAINNLQTGIQDYIAISDAISGLNLSSLFGTPAGVVDNGGGGA